jgi:hypothetical protein
MGIPSRHQAQGYLKHQSRCSKHQSRCRPKHRPQGQPKRRSRRRPKHQSRCRREFMILGNLPGIRTRNRLKIRSKQDSRCAAGTPIREIQSRFPRWHPTWVQRTSHPKHSVRHKPRGGFGPQRGPIASGRLQYWFPPCGHYLSHGLRPRCPATSPMLLRAKLPTKCLKLFPTLSQAWHPRQVRGRCES